MPTKKVLQNFMDRRLLNSFDSIYNIEQVLLATVNVDIDTLVNIVGTRRIILYGKLKGYTKIHVNGGRVYGWKDKRKDDISYHFAAEKYSHIVSLDL